MSATLANAAANALLHVEQRYFAAENIPALAISWANALATIGLSPEDSGNRTVLDWVTFGYYLGNNLVNNTSQGLLNANEVGIYIYRTCRAAQYALAANRITSTQATAILNAYNTLVGP